MERKISSSSDVRSGRKYSTKYSLTDRCWNGANKTATRMTCTASKPSSTTERTPRRKEGTNYWCSGPLGRNHGTTCPPSTTTTKSPCDYMPWRITSSIYQDSSAANTGKELQENGQNDQPSEAQKLSQQTRIPVRIPGPCKLDIFRYEVINWRRRFDFAALRNNNPAVDYIMMYF